MNKRQRYFLYEEEPIPFDVKIKKMERSLEKRVHLSVRRQVNDCVENIVWMKVKNEIQQPIIRALSGTMPIE